MIKVIIQRKLKEGMEQEFYEMTSQLRANAVPRRGYFSGETWVDANDPRLTVVISTWITMEDWQAWERSPQRQAIVTTLEPLLEEPTKTFILRPPQGIEVRSEVAMPVA